MLIRYALIPILRLLSVLKSGKSNAIYQSSLYFFKISKASLESIVQLRLRINKKNRINATLETGFFQTCFNLDLVPPAKREKIRVKKMNTFINAVLLGIKTIKEIAQKKAALLQNSLNFKLVFQFYLQI